MADDDNNTLTSSANTATPPCRCPAYDPACLRAGNPMTLRQWELCSGNCPPQRPCPPDAENYRRRWDSLPLVDLAPPSKPLPCVHLGEETGERRLCGSCKGSVALKVFTCGLPKYGRCTLSRKADGLACCAGCPDYLSPYHQDGVGAVRNLLYHVYPIAGNGVWQWNVGQLLRRISLFNGRRVVKIVTDGRTNSARDVKDLLTGHVHEFIELPNDPDLATGREVNGYGELLGRVETLNKAHVTFYGHAKGVTRPGMGAVRQWTEMLYETYLDHWPLVEGLLRQFPLAGALKRHGQPTGWPASTWHYSGSFLWFRNAALFSKPNWADPALLNFGPEVYPSQLFSREEAGLVFFEWPVQPIGMYQQHFIDQQVLPKLATWRKARQDETKARMVTVP